MVGEVPECGVGTGLMIVTFDAETFGPSGFEFQQKHPEFRVLFVGFLIDGKVFQVETKNEILQLLQKN